MIASAKQKPKIGIWISSSLVLGNMIGSGIFLLPASLAAYGGISVIGWIISSIGALLLAKVFAQLSLMIPKSGGPYTYTRAGFGDFAAFLVAWGYWISICATNAAITVAMLGYLTVFIPALGESVILSVSTGLASIWFLTWINTRGIQAAGRIQLITTVIKVLPLLAITLIGLFYIDITNFSDFNISGKSHLQAVTETATLTLFAFLGLECATIPAEDIKNGSTVARATMIGTYLAIGIYILSSIVLMGLISPAALQHSAAPFADAASLIWGDEARYLVAAGAVISTFGALNGWLLMQGQIPMSASRDGLFPKHFSKVNAVGSPALGIITSSVIVSVIMILNFSKGLVKAFEFMILLSTLTVLVPYLFSSATHILLSYHQSDKWFWLTGFLAFLFSLWAVIGSGADVVFWGFVLLMSGIPVYVFILLRAKHQHKN